MKLQAERVSAAGTHAPLLLPTSLEVRTGEVALVAGDPGYGHVALALLLGGRLTPSSGRVVLGGSGDPVLLRRHVALVDVPDVTAPEDAIPARAVIGEELALSGQRARGSDVTAFLDERDGRKRSDDRWETVPPGLRTRWLADLAARRSDVDVLVLANPDRFGGEPRDWWDVATGHADRGRAVVVQCTHASARLLGEPVRFELGVVR